MQLPNQDDDEFDRDITEPSDDGGTIEDFLAGFVHPSAYEALYTQFLNLTLAGFTESQALRFLAFCSIHEGDEAQ